jgi:CelD/BcsL family acetyltransferase involved in cellulose biosynthesis
LLSTPITAEFGSEPRPQAAKVPQGTRFASTRYWSDFTPHNGSMNMYVERIATWTELATLESQWNALAAGEPFRSWDWLATWWKHYGKRATDRQLSVLVAYDDAQPDEAGSVRRVIGIAPWYIDHSAIKGSVLRWLGDGEVCTDHVSLVCRSEDCERVATAIADALAIEHDDWDRVHLTAVDADDAPVGRLMAALDARECIVSQHAADACWALDLPATWEDYLAGISKSHRKQLRQLERRILESDRVEWHRVHTAVELDAAWAVLVDLHQRRRRSLGEPGCFSSKPFSTFHCEVIERLLARGQLRMSWLALDGEPAAAEYHMADGRATYAYQGGVDPGRLAEEPGRLSTILCLRQAIDEGHQRFDFLRGDEPYKAHWRATPRPACDYSVVPNRRLARLRGRVLNVADALSDWARQSAQLVHFPSST